MTLAMALALHSPRLETIPRMHHPQVPSPKALLGVLEGQGAGFAWARMGPVCCSSHLLSHKSNTQTHILKQFNPEQLGNQFASQITLVMEDKHQLFDSL